MLIKCFTQLVLQDACSVVADVVSIRIMSFYFMLMLLKTHFLVVTFRVNLLILCKHPILGTLLCKSIN